ncbi:MAG TPA: hypothetical protein VK932_01300 [Kofleriaceae bacterium]|nr:hypothetical protein [Kofleriaceae bacterium]
MPWKRVTCPETAHLAMIELERHPLGTLIAACSRFAPSCVPACSRSCAGLMDRRERLAGSRSGSRRQPHEPGEETLASLEVGDTTRYGLELDIGVMTRRDS